jgi:hypothetical protein
MTTLTSTRIANMEMAMLKVLMTRMTSITTMTRCDATDDVDGGGGDDDDDYR